MRAKKEENIVEPTMHTDDLRCSNTFTHKHTLKMNKNSKKKNQQQQKHNQNKQQQQQKMQQTVRHSPLNHRLEFKKQKTKNSRKSLPILDSYVYDYCCGCSFIFYVNIVCFDTNFVSLVEKTPFLTDSLNSKCDHVHMRNGIKNAFLYFKSL